MSGIALVLICGAPAGLKAQDAEGAGAAAGAAAAAGATRDPECPKPPLRNFITGTRKRVGDNRTILILK